ncbi:MAG: hypothetical protein R3D66_06405 [Alphaproteobacteria bacterium]
MSNPATTGRELDDLLQGAFGDVQLPDRPTGFPAGLPEPVFMNNGMIAAVNVGTSQQELRQTHLILRIRKRPVCPDDRARCGEDVQCGI